jgi:hypothetical protein
MYILMVPRHHRLPFGEEMSISDPLASIATLTREWREFMVIFEADGHL